MAEENIRGAGEGINSNSFAEMIRILPNVEMLLDVPFDGIYVTDRQRRIIFWNKGAENITGYSAAEVLGRPCSDNILNHIDVNGNLLCTGSCPLQRSMDEEKPIQAKIFPLHKKGHRFPVLTHVTPLKDNEGRIIGAIEYFRDITKAEDLRLLLQKFNKIIKRYVSFASYSEAFTQASTSREAKAEVLDLTILFLDIVGFTAFVETETPSEVVWALNTIFSLCEVPIRECRGDIDKFMGDAALAVFNDANDAVQAGIRIQKIIHRIDEDRLQEGKQSLPVRIGINSGMVIRGEVGSLTRKEVMVIGDPVNTAARVQTMAKPGSILVTESTYSRLKNPRDFRDIGELQLKGKNVNVRVYEYCGSVDGQPF